MRYKYFSIIIALCCAGCGIQISEIGAATPTDFIITSTLPPTLTPPPSETPLPPLPQPTVVPVDGTSSTPINVRSAPSTVSDVLGIIPANTKVQIIGKDPGENWWQILYPQGKEGKGWVAAQYILMASQPDVPVVGGGVLNPNNGNTAIIQQKLNIRSGPGTGFNSIGTLNAQDVVNLTGKDSNGAWLQIEFASGPEGKGWINAAFAQAQGVENLPIVTEAGLIVGTGTPTGIPLTPTPTVIPAPLDNDSAQAPAINITFSATGLHSFQYSSDVSAPNGDGEDWIQFTSFTQTVHIELTCIGNGFLSVEVLQNNQPIQSLACGANGAITTNAGAAYLLHIQAIANDNLSYTQYTLKIISMP